MLEANFLTGKINFDHAKPHRSRLGRVRAICVAASVMLVMGPANVAMAASDPNLNFKIYSPPDSPAAAPAAPADASAAAPESGDMPAAKSSAEPAESPKSVFEEAMPQLDTTPDKPAGALPANAGPDTETNTSAAPLATPAPAAAAPAATTSSAAPASDGAAGTTAVAAPAASATTEAAATPAAAATTDAAPAGTVTEAAAPDTKADGAKGDKVLQGYIRVVPKETKIPIIMDTAVDSDTSQESDEFSARTSEDLTIDGTVVVPAGSVIKGRIAQLNAPKAMNRSGTVALKFDTITTPDNRQIPLVANIVARGGVVHARRGMKDIAIDATAVALPTILGGAIGYLAGKKSTTSTTTSTTKNIGKPEAALIGIGIGVAVGCIILCAKKGKKVEVRPGDELKIELAEDLRMPTM